MQDCWIDLQRAAALLGIADSTFDRRVRKRVAADGRRRVGYGYEYRLDALIQAFAAYRVDAALAAERRKQRRVPAELRGEPDAAAIWGGGGDSPALERLRLAKAEHAELDLAARKGEVLSRAGVVHAWNLAHDGVRRLIERWERRQRGSEAQELRDAMHAGMQALGAALRDAEGTNDAETDSDSDGGTGSEADGGSGAVGSGSDAPTGGSGG